MLQVTKTRTTPYRPASNGQVERYNRILLQLIRCHIRSNQNTWDEHLQQLAGAIRATVNRQTGFTANMIVFGREVLQPVDLMYGGLSHDRECGDEASYVSKLRDSLVLVHQIARQNLRAAQMRQKKDYGINLRQKYYQVGDAVYQLDSATKVGQSSSLRAIWKGPYLVVKVLPIIIFIKFQT